MAYVSQPLPLEFWTRLLVRLEQEFKTRQEELAVLLKPLPTNIDSAAHMLSKAEKARQEAKVLLVELTELQVLQMMLRSQTRTRAYEVQLPEREDYVACLRNISEMQAVNLLPAPRRLLIENDLMVARSGMDAMKNAGVGEMQTAERNRLKNLCFELPVLGAEDVKKELSNLRETRTVIDQQEAELQRLKVSTMMEFIVTDAVAPLLHRFGIQVFARPKPLSESDSAEATPPEERAEPASSESSTTATSAIEG